MKHTAILLATLALTAGAQTTFTFPEKHTGIINLKTEYGAKGDGVTDDTAAIQAALNDHPSADRVLYLPDGVYRVSDTLRWSRSRAGNEEKRIILQGQSTRHTIIRLADNTPAFSDPAKPKAVVWTGEKPAQRFRNGIRTLTIHTGSGNPGAIGVQYIANNQGSMRNVLIVDGGDGRIGLDLGYTSEQGPCLIKDVEVRGFDTGISCRHGVNSITLENILLSGQRVAGLVNRDQCLSIRKFKSVNRVPGIVNEGAVGHVVLLNGEFENPSPETAPHAVRNTAAMLLRDCTTTGYALAVRNEPTQKHGAAPDAPGGQVREYTTHTVVTAGFPDTRTATLRLPVKETPEPPVPDFSRWASPLDFGAKADGKSDDTAAMQAAMNSGAQVVYFPSHRSVSFDNVVSVPSTVLRVTAFEGGVKGKGTFHVAGGSAEPIHFDRMDWIYTGLNLLHDSPRPLVISGIMWGNGKLELRDRNAEVFIEDLCLGTLDINGNTVWARQLNAESGNYKVLNNGGTFWCLGMKTEQAGVICETRKGRTELLGGFVYSQGKEKTTPMFVVEDSLFAASIGEAAFHNPPRNFKVILRETRNGETRELPTGKPFLNRPSSALILLLCCGKP